MSCGAKKSSNSYLLDFEAARQALYSFFLNRDVHFSRELRSLQCRRSIRLAHKNRNLLRVVGCAGGARRRRTNQMLGAVGVRYDAIHSASDAPLIALPDEKNADISVGAERSGSEGRPNLREGQLQAVSTTTTSRDVDTGDSHNLQLSLAEERRGLSACTERLFYPIAT
jgi:hypothetical protein